MSFSLLFEDPVTSSVVLHGRDDGSLIITVTPNSTPGFQKHHNERWTIVEENVVRDNIRSKLIKLEPIQLPGSSTEQSSNETQEHSNDVQEHSNDVQEHSNDVQEHSNDVQEHSNDVQEHSNDVQEHSNDVQEQSSHRVHPSREAQQPSIASRPHNEQLSKDIHPAGETQHPSNPNNSHNEQLSNNIHPAGETQHPSNHDDSHNEQLSNNIQTPKSGPHAEIAAVIKKFLDKWNKEKEGIDINKEMWTRSPQLFFANNPKDMPGEWSFNAIQLFENEYPRMMPFHKLFLANRYPHVRHKVYRHFALDKCCPDWDREPIHRQRNLERSFKTRINHGRIFGLIQSLEEGFMITICPFLTYDDLKLIEKHMPLFMILIEPLVALAKTYSELSKAALEFDEISQPESERTEIEHNPVVQQYPLLDGDRTTRNSSVITTPSAHEPNQSPISIQRKLALMVSEFPANILLLGAVPQQRWGEQGNVIEIDLFKAGLDEELARILSDQTQVNEVIRSHTHDDEPSVTTNSSSALPQVEQDWLNMQRLIFLGHIYPRDEVLQKSFVEAVLAATTSSSTHRTNTIARLASLLSPDLPIYLKLAIVDKQGSLLRLEGEYHQSDFVLYHSLSGIDIQSPDMRIHCSYGRVVLSLTENMILQKDYGNAQIYMDHWGPRKSPNPCLEQQVIDLKCIALGRISRYQGYFKHAAACLESCSSTLNLTPSRRFHALHHLADVLCEMRVPGQAENLVRDEIDRLRLDGRQRSKAYRRLLLSFGEALIEQGSLQKGNDVFFELYQIFADITAPDVSDQLGHVRSAFGLLRIASKEGRWSDALQCSKWAEGLAQKYQTFSDGDFYVGLIFMYQAVACFEMQKWAENLTALAAAENCDKGPRHLIPGMGTYVRDELILKVTSQNQQSSFDNALPNSLSADELLGFDFGAEGEFVDFLQFCNDLRGSAMQ
ncbi:uncharacterized protein E2P81_ATG10738 [Venturia nashicola]|nr:uncharacterized protein E2P81_ATG10738 [Venturia nashicola]